MFRRLGVIALSVLLLFSLGTTSLSANAMGKQKESQRGNQDKQAMKWVKEKLRHMSVEEKVGQLFIIHAYGKTPDDPAYEETNLNDKRGGATFKDIIEKYHIGGVIYFNWSQNIGTPLDAAQAQNLSNGLQKIAMNQKSKIPLFISTDQEGGIVTRVTEPATVFPGNMALGAARSNYFAEKTGRIIGTELKSLGINMDFAPDLDVNVNPENPVIGVRSYSSDPDLVSAMGTSEITGIQSRNVLAAGKHFPGHGDTNVDSHYGLPIVNHDLKTLENVDFKPFKAAIKSGVDAIMTAHIVVPALDSSGLPATLSKPIMTGILRNKLGFKGLIVTDSLDMAGANVLPADQVPVAAFNAGADILLNPPDVPLAYNSVLKAVKSNVISKQRLDQSVERILLAKYKRGLVKEPLTSKEELKNIGIPGSLVTANEITEKSITLLKNENNILPLNKHQRVLVAGPAAANTQELAGLLRDKGFNIESIETTTSPSADQTQNAIDQSKNADVIVIPTYNANTNSAQKAFVQGLEKTEKPIVIAAMRNPYDIMAFPEVNANILTYGNGEISTRALAKAIAGEVNPEGRLPVSIPGLYSFGSGLRY
ncbi:glycoside hydrolase family 3 protein [Heyndrickxia acidicola]|uniref:beta-N-acetylhexosaminidase n=1 Tax=Heyndrickxia acidicola TaxID=209389 RepID=A0ABU6MCY0_9BACI|nr:glycoside hydrolase family 3 protein [Heyndrickxia acidicola]MED1202278.1 glycoside hydrolase family 3 protein [Heyndrickxia acidicola]